MITEKQGLALTRETTVRELLESFQDKLDAAWRHGYNAGSVEGHGSGYDEGYAAGYAAGAEDRHNERMLPV